MKLRVPLIAFALAGGLGLFMAWPVRADDPTDQQKTERAVRAALRLMIDLASEASSEEVAAARDTALAFLYQEIFESELERRLAQDLSQATPAGDFTALIAAEGQEPAYYLRAARRSYPRFTGAQQAGQSEWMSKHLKAAQQYVGLAVEGLIVEAKRDEDRAAEWQSQHFAVRRPRAQAAAFLAKLKANGLSSEHRTLALESGYQESELADYLQELVATAPDQLGLSMVELLMRTAHSRRELAASLRGFASGSTTPSSQSPAFVIGNPHDREETIDLFIRRASLPPAWRVSIVDAEPVSAEMSQTRVQEVETGRHYRVHLPAKGQMHVASVLVPVGAVGENTTARWAVEGMIGDEPIGGMVQEMPVPGVIADVTLPPIEPGAAAGTGAASVVQSRGIRIVVIVAASLVVIAIVLFVFVGSRRRA